MAVVVAVARERRQVRGDREETRGRASGFDAHRPLFCLLALCWQAPPAILLIARAVKAAVRSAAAVAASVASVERSPTRVPQQDDRRAAGVATWPLSLLRPWLSPRHASLATRCVHPTWTRPSRRRT